VKVHISLRFQLIMVCHRRSVDVKCFSRQSCCV